jgi:serine/threonine protein kinase
MVRLQLDEEAIFKIAVEITRPETRADYLDQVCAGNAALLHRVTMLLDAHLKSPNYLESPPPGIAVTLDSSSKGVACPQGDASRFAGTYRVGAQIGPYKIREQLAEGGMGVVYVAEQIEPVHRKVALKIIKPGMATREVIARFEAERQALAMMEHPHIARIIDAGTTEFGQPFFVMELVYGVPITQKPPAIIC